MLGNYISANFNRTNSLKRLRPFGNVLSIENASKVKRLNRVKEEEQDKQSLVDYLEEKQRNQPTDGNVFRLLYYFVVAIVFVIPLVSSLLVMMGKLIY